METGDPTLTHVSALARRIGIVSATLTVILLVAYAVTLAIGLATLPAPDQPIREPMLSLMEILIIAMMPAILAMMAALHAWTPARAKVASLMAVILMAMTTALTTIVHVLILTLSRQEPFLGAPWSPWMLSFKWPSVVYVLDIIAWDWFFALSMLFAAAAMSGSRLALTIRWLMVASGVLSLVGLAGVFTNDMQIRNIGIIGYVGVFLVVAILLAVLFGSTARIRPQSARAVRP